MAWPDESLSSPSGRYCYIRTGGTTHKWTTEQLWLAARGRPSVSLPLSEFNFDVDVWFDRYETPTVAAVLTHYARMLAADLAFPILLWRMDRELGNSLWRYGALLDGGHRLAKAAWLGAPTIDAVVFDSVPPFATRWSDEETPSREATAPAGGAEVRSAPWAR